MVKNVLLISTLLAATGCAGLKSQGDAWSKVQTTAIGTPQSIGTGSAGCLQGAESLTPDGPGFHVMRISRRRFYGHPALIQALREISAEAYQAKLGTLLIGDLSQPRGGPSNSNHVSHQSGLNVDLWIQQAEDFAQTGVTPTGLSLDARENFYARSVLFSDRLELNPSFWSDKKTELLKKIASRKDLDRVLVSPAIKKFFCERFNSPENISWMSKIRPWYGHDDHFHLTFKCPENDLLCVPPKPVVQDNACDATLEWWWSEEARQVKEAPAEKPSVTLPERCNEVLSDITAQH